MCISISLLGRQTTNKANHIMDSYFTSCFLKFSPCPRLYGPGPSSCQAIDLQDLTRALPGALESSGSSQSLSPGAGAQDHSHTNSKRLDSAEVKILVAAEAREQYERKSMPSLNKLVFVQKKNLAQAKEKWSALFEKYKSVCDSNSRARQGRESFEF